MTKNMIKPALKLDKDNPIKQMRLKITIVEN